MKSFRIYYVLILLILFITFTSAHFYFTFVLLLAFLILPVVTFIIGLINYFFVDISIVQQGVVNGQNSQIISIYNKSIFPIPLCIIKFEIYNKFIDKKEVQYIKCPIKSRDRLDINVNTVCNICGVCDYYISNLKTIDYLGVFSFSKKLKDIKVSTLFLHEFYNNIEKDGFISEFYDSDSDRYSHNKKGDDNTEIFQIREYQSGDDVRRIHWKLSALQDKTMIKDYSLPVSIGLFIFLDVQNNKEKNSETKSAEIVKIFGNIAIGLIENNAVFTVIYYDVFNSAVMQKKIENKEHLFEVITSVLSCNYNNYILEDIINFSDKSINNIIYLTTKNDYNSDMLDKVNNASFISSSDYITTYDIDENHKYIKLNETNINEVTDSVFNSL